MKVTPRLPIHGPYLQSPYVEMRYFRYGNYSLPVAVLFSLSEASSFPFDMITKSQLRDEISHYTSSGRELIELSMNRGVAAKNVLAAWNSQENAIFEAIQHMTRMNLAELAQHLEDKFQLQLVRCGSEGAERPDMDSLYWDQWSDGGVVLLYKEYGQDSIVALDCGHIYLKSTLYRIAREAMQKPRTQQEMTDIPIMCQGENCTNNLSNHVFDMGRKDAEMSNLAPAEQSAAHSLTAKEIKKKCQNCYAEKGKRLCTNETCLLCISCATIASMTMLGFHCPLCGYRYQSSSIDAIIQGRNQIIGAVVNEELPRCLKCKRKQSISEFSAVMGTNHGCWLCDSCIREINVRRPVSSQLWPCCGYEILKKERGEIVKWQGKHMGSRSSDEEERCILCEEIKKEKDYHYKKLKEHSCQICDQCFTSKVDSLGTCPICSESFTLSKKSIGKSQCDQCRLPKEPADYLLYIHLQHPCKLCNICVLSSMNACLSCSISYSERDIEVIVSKAGDIIEGKRCYCGNLITKGHFSCINACFCSLCHLANMLLTNTRKCRNCAIECTGDVAPRIPCSRCYRDMQTRNPAKLTVSGICAKGHILCQHCVKVAGDQLSCPVCNTPVQGRAATELSHAQGKLFLACFCEEGAGELVPLRCEHLIHPKCKGMMVYCRICGEDALDHYKEKPKEETLWKYAK